MATSRTQLAQTLADLKRQAGSDKTSALLLGISQAFRPQTSFQPLPGVDFGQIGSSLQRADRNAAFKKFSAIQEAGLLQTFQKNDRALRRQSNFLKNKDDLIKGMEPFLSKGQISVFKGIEDADTFFKVSAAAAQADATGNIKKQIAQFNQTNKTRGAIAKNNADFAENKITKAQFLDKDKLLRTREESGLKSLADVIKTQLARGEANQGTKAAQVIRDRAAAVATSARLTVTVANILEKSGGDVQALVAGARKLIAGARSQVAAIVKANPGLSSTLGKAARGDVKAQDKFDFGNMATEGAEFKSTMLNLAILKARAEEKGRLSDDDIQRGLTQVGANAFSPGEALGAMFASLRNSVSRIEDEIDIGLAPDIRARLKDLAGGGFRKKIRQRLGRFADPVFSGNLLFGGKTANSGNRVIGRRKAGSP
jgi:hypothetical protein